jgi:phosphoribosylformylglycinamidine cyclo-ligase
VEIRALAHITGGGLPENLPRVLPEGFQAEIDANSWEIPEIFTWLRDAGGVAPAELLRTFNCGVGMVAVVAQDAADTAIDILASHGETAWRIGNITEGDNGVVIR